MNLVLPLIVFAVLILSANQIGRFATRYRLPLISGYLFAGILIGPFVLHLLTEESVAQLRFIDEVALGFIAISAGCELYLRDLQGRLSSIAWNTIALTTATFLGVAVAVYGLASFVPFMRDMPTTARIAVSLLTGAIMVARSPSSAIAIINELRAKGPFTQTAIGVTVVTDVVVIVLFAVNSSIADVLVSNDGFNATFLLLLIGELAAAFLLGIAVYFVLLGIINLKLSDSFKIVLILLLGYSIFLLSTWVHEESHTQLPFDIFLEPLLVLMVGGFLIANRSGRRLEFMHLIEKASPAVYLAFFTLTGAELELGVLSEVWVVALLIVGVRLVTIFIGALVGGTLAGDPPAQSRIAWMVYITQAGVGLGLAKEVGVEFPAWGIGFVTLLVGIIVINQLIGPPFFKWAISHVGEAHTRAAAASFDHVHDAIIFGIDNQSKALARQLLAHDWAVRLVTEDPTDRPGFPAGELDIVVIDGISAETLTQIDMEHADAVVCMFPNDDDNYRVCELVYEQFGNENIIVRLNDEININRFRELKITIIDPRMAMVSLLDQFVRSPSATSLLLGMVAEEDVIDIEVVDPALHGMPLRDLQLPEDVLILSIRREGDYLITHGYTILKLGDKVSILGSPESLSLVSLRFEA